MSTPQKQISTLDINRDTPREGLDIVRELHLKIIDKVVSVGVEKGILKKDEVTDAIKASIAKELTAEIAKCQPTPNDSKQSNETHLELHKGPIDAA